MIVQKVYKEGNSIENLVWVCFSSQLNVTKSLYGDFDKKLNPHRK